MAPTYATHHPQMVGCFWQLYCVRKYVHCSDNTHPSFVRGNPMSKLQGKVAIVTGAGQGVGLGIALSFAEEGATVVITGRHEDKLRAAAEQIRAKGAPDVLTVVG